MEEAVATGATTTVAIAAVAEDVAAMTVADVALTVAAVAVTTAVEVAAVTDALSRRPTQPVWDLCP